MERPSKILQPFFVHFVRGDHLFDLHPKSFRVIHVHRVREFVCDDVINDVERCHDQPPVEIDVFLSATRTPACLGARELENFVGEIMPLTVVLQALGEDSSRLLAIPLLQELFSLFYARCRDPEGVFKADGGSFAWDR